MRRDLRRPAPPSQEPQPGGEGRVPGLCGAGATGLRARAARACGAGALAARLARIALLLLAVTLGCFLLMRAAGGDVVTARMEATQVLSADLAEAERHRLGLDRPLLVQYLSWLGGLVSFGGRSMVTGEAVFPLFASRLPATLALMTASLLLTLAAALPAGVVAAFHRGGWVDRAVRACAFVGNALPGFLVALLLAYLLGVRVHWLPVVSRGAGASGIVLPALTLAVAMSAKYVRQVRTAVAEELAQPYAQAAWARGLPAWRVAALTTRACLPTLLTLLGLSVGSLLGGTAVIETVFMWDGVGRMAVDAIGMRDYPVLLTYVMWMTIGYVLVAAVVDWVSAWADPRVRQP